MESKIRTLLGKINSAMVKSTLRAVARSGLNRGDRMKYVSAALCLSFAILSASISQAGEHAVVKNTVYVNGLQLNDMCSDPNGQIWCNGYLLAALDNDAVSMANGNTPPHWQYCVPYTGDAEQSQLVVKNWMRNNPERLNVNGTTVVKMAMVEAFPCD